MKRVLLGITLLIVLGICSLAAFTAGILTDRSNLLPLPAANNRVNNPTPSAADSSQLQSGLIEQAFETIQKNYADRATLEETNLTYSAINGMVDSLGDTGHSRFLTPQMVVSERNAIQGEFEGIGAYLNVNEAGNPVIVAPMDGSPAQKAGVRPGDIIMAVNGEDVSHMALNDVVSRVLGPAGTDVTLTLMDPDTKELRDVTIKRAKIVIHNVTWQMLPGTSIAHVRISSYSQNVSKDLADALKAAQKDGAQSIILDLRNNPGGLLNEATDVIGQFIKNGNALQVKDAKGNVSNIKAESKSPVVDLPMVALINQGSASAAEITAGALQDYKRATLVGQTTFGTGTVLNQFDLADGSAILLATELWLTPNGRQIWHQGIQPDIEVVLPADVTLSMPENERNMTAADLAELKDTQLKKAVELLQNQ